MPKTANWDFVGGAQDLRLDGSLAERLNPAQNSNDFTVAGVVAPDVVSGGNRGILSKYVISSTYRNWMLFQEGADIRFLINRDGSSQTTNLTLAGLSVSTKSFICGRYKYVADNTSIMDLDVDTANTGVTNARGPIHYDVNSHVQIANYGGGTAQPFNGKIYWLAYWNRKLSDDEVAGLEDGTILAAELSPDFYMDFHQPVGATYVPEIGNENGIPEFAVNGTPTHNGLYDTSLKNPELTNYDFQGTDQNTYMMLDGANDQMATLNPGHTDNPGSGSFTCLAMINPSALGTHSRGIFGPLELSGGNYRAWQLMVGTDSTMFAQVSDDGNNNTNLTSGVTLSTGVKSFVGMKYGYNGVGTVNDLKIWQDTTTDSVANARGPIYSNDNANVYIGKFGYGSNAFYQGKMYWIAYWNKELTDAQIEAIRDGTARPWDFAPDMYIDFTQPIQYRGYRTEMGGLSFLTTGTISPSLVSRTRPLTRSYEPDSSCWLFDGTNDRLRFPGGDPLATVLDPAQNSDDFTVAGMILPNTNTRSPDEGIFTKWAAADPQRCWRVKKDDQDLIFSISKNGLGSTNITHVTEASSLNVGEPAFFCGRYAYVADGTSDMSLLVNDSETSTSSAVGPVHSNIDTSVKIADFYVSAENHHYDGYIFWLAYWNRKLTDAEATALGNGSVTPAELAPDFYWDGHRQVLPNYRSEIGNFPFAVEGAPRMLGTGLSSVSDTHRISNYEFDGAADDLRMLGTHEKAVLFDPVSQTNDFTVMGVINPGVITGNNKGIFGKFKESGSNRAWELYQDDDIIRMYISRDGGSTNRDYIGASGLVAGVDTFVCGRYKFIADGTSELSVEHGLTRTEIADCVGPVFSTTDADIQIGDYDASVDRHYTGKIYWLAYWNRKLNDWEVAQLRVGKLTPWDLGADFYIDMRKPNLGEYISEIGRVPFVVNGAPVVTDPGGYSHPKILDSSFWRAVGSKPEGAGVGLDLHIGEGGEQLQPKDLLDGLIAWYKLDGDFADIGPNTLDGTPAGSPVHVTGKVGGCYDFNGSSQYADIGDDAALNPSSISVAAWIKLDGTAGGNQQIAVKRTWWSGANGLDVQWSLRLNNDTARWTIRTGASGGDHTDLDVADVLTTNWQHLVGTYDGARSKLYLDGVLIGDVAPTVVAGLVTTDYPFVIGARADGSGSPYSGRADYFAGLIDQVGIWDRALTEREVQELYGKSWRRRGLVAYYNLGGTPDDFGPNGLDGTLVGSPAVVEGRIGTCYEFNGSTQYIDLDTPTEFNVESISVAAWINSDAGYGSDNGMIATRSTWPFSTTSAWQLYAAEGQGTWDFVVFNSSGAYESVSGNALAASTWIHVIGTYNAATNRMRFYQNGILTEEIDGPAGGMHIPTGTNVLIGARGGSGTKDSYFDGKIDEVKIFDRPLSAEEAKAIYDESVPRRYEDMQLQSGDMSCAVKCRTWRSWQSDGLFGSWLNTDSEASWLLYSVDEDGIRFYTSDDGTTATSILNADGTEFNVEQFFAGTYEWITSGTSKMRLYCDHTAEVQNDAVDGPLFQGTLKGLQALHHDNLNTVTYWTGDMWWAAYFPYKLPLSQITALGHGFAHPVDFGARLALSFNEDGNVENYQAEINGSPSAPYILESVAGEGDLDGAGIHRGLACANLEQKEGVLGSWHYFDATLQYYYILGTDSQIDDFTPALHGNDFSIVTWFWPQDLSVPYSDAVFGRFHTGSNNRAYTIVQVDGPNEMQAAISKNGQSGVGSANYHHHSLLAAQEDYFMAMTYKYIADGTSRYRSWLSNKDLSINDPIEELAAVGPIYSPIDSVNLYIAQNQGSSTNHEWHGRIYMVAYFPRELTLEEVALLQRRAVFPHLVPDCTMAWYGTQKSPADPYVTEFGGYTFTKSSGDTPTSEGSGRAVGIYVPETRRLVEVQNLQGNTKIHDNAQHRGLVCSARVTRKRGMKP